MSGLCALADVKTYLGITDANSDAVLTALVSNASAMVEGFCNRTFAQASYTETVNGNGRAQLCLKNTPVTAVSSLAINDVPVLAAVGATGAGYVFDDMSVYVRSSGCSCAFSKGVQNVTVTYTAGYVAIPLDVAQACIELVAQKFAKRNRIDKASETLGTQQTISFSQADMPAQVRTALKPYVRWGSP
ncbi:hypothetical protein RHOFW104T7_13135 [Rhodanobacter thiooxydans]|uniref:Phage gp6-like head-tail connector protein n=1 Tax=Rhodanobacter thiooxydans TaxID=416169 RepID=A0A154QGW4_9GAMM|nr:phage head-tail connector protein [Rhodanobacter thiooxydans]KZC23540.1 hypothetical protein RHOFW104T7_13135 [Rhodanobacter thiooxydans]